jgi:hypothetical protein
MTLNLEPSPEDLPGTAAQTPSHAVRTVPRELVHCTVSEVLITDMSALNDNIFEVGARWPRSHSFFEPRAGIHNPMLLVETVRQAGMAIAHKFYGVPRAEKIVWQDVTYTVEEDGLRFDDADAELTLFVGAYEIRRRGARVAGMRLEYTVDRDGEPVASGQTTWSSLTPAAYARVRGERHIDPGTLVPLAPPVPPATAGRVRPEDVLLAATPLPNTFLLRVDQGNHRLFDHPQDHAPGMAVAEAARQAALLTLARPGAVALHGSFAFERYIELDEPCVVTVVPRPAEGDAYALQVTFEQLGRTAVTCQVDVVDRD